MKLLWDTSTSLGRRMLPEVTLHSYMACRIDSCCSRTIDLASFRIKWMASLRDRIDKQMGSKTDKYATKNNSAKTNQKLRDLESGEKSLHRNVIFAYIRSEVSSKVSLQGLNGPWTCNLRRTYEAEQSTNLDSFSVMPKSSCKNFR